jgi:hypothetical protein
MRFVQFKGVGDANDEVAHGFRVHQVFPALRATESAWIDGDQLRDLAQPRPHLVEREHASGQGLSSMACRGPVPPSAKRIDSPSMVVFVDESAWS